MGASNLYCAPKIITIEPYNAPLDVQGLRAQIDRKLYKKYMQEMLFNYPNLDIRAASVHDLLWTDQNPIASSSSNSSPDQPPVWARVAGVRLGE